MHSSLQQQQQLVAWDKEETSQNAHPATIHLQHFSHHLELHMGRVKGTKYDAFDWAQGSTVLFL